MSNRPPCRTVFVGNIAYELSEQQLIDIFKEAGPVLDFRLVFDRDTGKPKGYGFVTFADLETASSAVRNLSGYDLCGRQLRMDFAENEKEGIETLKPIESGNTNPIGSTMAPPATGGNSAMPAHSGNGGQHPFAPSPFQGYPAPQGMSGSYQNSEVAIANLISSSNPQQLIELMSQMKAVVQTHPDQARALLLANPQLSYTLFQAMLVSNIVNHNLLQRILQSPVTSAPAAMPESKPMAPIIAQPQPPMQAPVASMEGLQEHQKQLLMQVLALTPEQINMLPPDQRENILQLRSQLMQQQ